MTCRECQKPVIKFHPIGDDDQCVACAVDQIRELLKGQQCSDEEKFLCELADDCREHQRRYFED